MIRVVNLRSITKEMRESGLILTIDRSSIWGNPYRLDQGYTRQASVEAYLRYAKQDFDRQSLLELDGHALGCHCAPLLCHGNALQLLVAEAKGVTRPWVLVSGEAPRRGAPMPPDVEADYRRLLHARLGRLPKSAVVVHGGAPGIDTMADEWCRENIVDVVRWPADWGGSDRAAGPRRNQFMLDHCPIDTVLCFHRDIRNSTGTKDMLERAKREHYEYELHTTQQVQLDGVLWDGPIT